MLIFTAQAQIIVDTKLDRAEIVIGEQVDLTATVSADARQRVEFPTYAVNDTLTAGVEVLSCSEVDTAWLNNGKRVTLTRKYVLTSFDSALYALPSLQVLVDGKAYKSRDRLGLKVNTLPVDTVHVDQYAPPFTVAETPFVWRNFLLLRTLLPWLTIVLIFACAVRLTNAKPVVRRIKVKPPVPPYKKAVSALSQLDAAGERDPLDDKAFYMRLTDVLREYMHGRYAFNALEKTTAEIIDGMTEYVENNLLSGLQSLFNLSDSVKFAKATSSAVERKRCVDFVSQFLEETKSTEQENARPKTVIVTLSGRNQKLIRIALWSGLSLFTLCALVGAGWAALQIYEVYL